MAMLEKRDGFGTEHDAHDSAPDHAHVHAAPLPPLPLRRAQAKASAEPTEKVTAQIEQPMSDNDSPRGGAPSGDAFTASHSLPTLPSSAGGISRGRKLWFLASVVAPIVIGTGYLFLIAPDQYVTEYRYNVRLPVTQQSAGSMGSGAAAALFGGNPTPGSDLIDNYTVTDYARSAQAARDLEARVGLKAMFGKPSDPFARIGQDASAEDLASYWHRMVYADYDPASGLAVVRVRAYSPEDSYRIATTLLQLSDDLVNSIGRQSQQDSLRFAEMEMQRASGQVAQLRARLASLRRSQNVVDPANSVVSGNAAMTNALRANLVQIESQMAMVMQQLHNPDAPQMRVLRQQLDATRAQLAQISAQVGSGNAGLASTVGEFEDVNTRLSNAVQVLQTSTANLSQAQSNADSQRLYLTTYVKPVLPQSSTEPDRWVSLLIVAIGAVMIWILGMLLGNSVREHGQ